MKSIYCLKSEMVSEIDELNIYYDNKVILIK